MNLRFSQPQMGEKYIICDSDLLIEDKKDYDERKGKIQGGNGINALKKNKNIW